MELNSGGRRPEVMRQLGRLRCRWENNIKIDFKEIGSGGVGCVTQAQGRVQRHSYELSS
jgi:hypothetical protein